MLENVIQAKRIVIKLGTQIVIQEDGSLAEDRLHSLISQCAQLVCEGRNVLLVSSGAVGLGRQVLNLKEPKLALAEKQACAAVGQNLLMDLYRESFEKHQLVTAQLLLTALDFSDRQRYLNLKETFKKLLDFGVIPVINENDTVSITEIQEDKTKSFGDNDKLSALVASKLDADLLIILTNVAGIYTQNPLTHPDAALIPIIEGFEQLKEIGLDGKSMYGRGGMATKVEAAKIASMSGVHTLIASGLTENILLDACQGKDIPGTWIMAQNAIPGRKRWLGLASGYNGVVVVNDGAKQALVSKGASLLPIGIVDVQGDFQSRQIVSIQDEDGIELGRGLIHFSAQETRQIQGQQSQEISKILGLNDLDHEVVIHRDNLVIYQEYSV